MPEYRFVTKAEYGPVKNDLEKIIVRVQRYMRKNYRLTLQPQLIGSGRRHLITMIEGGNKGYDFDYNLVIQKLGNVPFEAAVLKEYFIEAFEVATKGTTYSHPKDSTSVITIKAIDRKNSRVQHHCDFAIVYYDVKDGKRGYYYLINNKKKNNSYSFGFRPFSDDSTDEKVRCICEWDRQGGWNRIRNKYLALKNTNKRTDKRSFSLYVEAVNNVYNQLQIERRKKGRGK